MWLIIETAFLKRPNFFGFRNGVGPSCRIFVDDFPNKLAKLGDVIASHLKLNYHSLTDHPLTDRGNCYRFL